MLKRFPNSHADWSSRNPSLVFSQSWNPHFMSFLFRSSPILQGWIWVSHQQEHKRFVLLSLFDSAVHCSLVLSILFFFVQLIFIEKVWLNVRYWTLIISEKGRNNQGKDYRISPRKLTRADAAKKFFDKRTKLSLDSHSERNRSENLKCQRIVALHFVFKLHFYCQRQTFLLFYRVTEAVLRCRRK